MTPEQKAEYYLEVYNNDLNSCVKQCDSMIKIGIMSDYYEKVKEILNKIKLS